MILLVDLERDILQYLFGLVCDLQSGSTSTNTYHTDGALFIDGMLLYSIAIEVLIVPLVLVYFIRSGHDPGFRGHADLDNAFRGHVEETGRAK
jgi:hypothetical protein